MIINTLDDNKIKIIIDKTDLNKAGIPTEDWISNSNQTLFYIEHLLKSTTNLSILPNKLVLKDYYISTYNYIVFSITLFQEQRKTS